MKNKQIKLTQDIYQIIAHSTDLNYYTEGRYSKRYVEFNPQSYITENPIFVTPVGYRANSVVLFESEEQAQKFLESFKVSRDHYTYEIKKYIGNYHKCDEDALYTYFAEKVDTKYGECYRIKCSRK